MVSQKGVDVVHDLNKFPYPFKSNFFDEIYASCILEHLDNPKKFVEELWRISKSGAKILIGTVHFSAPTVWGDIEHKRPFQSDSMNWCNVKFKYNGNLSLVDTNPSCFSVKQTIHLKYFFKPLKFLVNINRYTQLIYERWFSSIFRADGQTYEMVTIKGTRT